MNNNDSKKIIFWDIGNVLVKFLENDFMTKLKEVRLEELSEEEFETRYRKIMDQSFLGLITLDETWLRILALINKQGNEKEFWEDQYQSVLNEELLDFIKANQENYHFGLISDLNQIAHSRLMAFHGDILKFFQPELVYLSNQTGRSKRDHGISFFKNIFSSLGNNHGGIIYIDDDQANVSLAESVGVKGILFPKLKIGESWSDINKVILNNIYSYQNGKKNRENN